jgi:hypothetical protein
MAVCWRYGACGPAGVLFCPVECVVGDLFPSILTKGVVGTAREGLEFSDGRRVLVVLEVRLVQSEWLQVVFASSDQEQRRTVVVFEVDVGVVVTRGEVGEHAVPDEAAGRGDVEVLIDLVGLLFGQRVRESVVELLGGEPDSAMAVGRVLEHGKSGLGLDQR